MRKQERDIYFSEKARRDFFKSVKRKNRKQIRKANFYKHYVTLKRNAEERKFDFHKPIFEIYLGSKTFVPKYRKPEYSTNIKYLASIKELFSKEIVREKEDGKFEIPVIFSLIDNYKESFYFLKRLFACLYFQKTNQITLDYSKCNRIDVDASACMDILLGEFIYYKKRCNRIGYEIKPTKILPIKFEKPEIMKILFSIGAYKNLKGYEIKFDDIDPLPLMIGIRNQPYSYEKCEVALTHIVEYIKGLLTKLNRDLTTDAEDNLYKVLGEIMINAEEHGTMPHWYCIGHFQEINTEEHFGIFNFSIFNFGETIYQTFKSSKCPAKVVEQMKELSKDFTRRSLFKKSEFEEETLWTLYALQQRVTSKPERRGNGSIQVIESFFKLKGDLMKDDISKFLIVSGNTRILFDGTYGIIQKEKEGEKSKIKMITFNDSEDIRDKPDKKFVTFAENYFPGTLISARILIKYNNTNVEEK